MAHYIKVGGVWRTVSADQDANCGYVKVGGVWKTATNAYVKVAGVWRSYCEPPVTTTTTATTGVTYVTVLAIALPAASIILKFQMYANPEPKTPSAIIANTGPGL